ncbi:MAG: stage V sporulation protein AD [Erysipelotrichaceae bacterium]|nr:stage V sporulation protein AD [Erysipelotrichaceae bacterium]
MTTTYKNVYLKETSTIAGNYEANGPLKSYYDKTYTKDLYFGETSWEHAEIKLLKDSISLLLKKSKLKENDVDLLISGDLQNQIASSDYASREFNIPFLGIYNACATSSEGIIIASTFIDSKQAKNCIVSTVSHNTAAEKQYRNPTEYGTPKPETATFTVTGSASILLTSEKTDIRIESATIGKTIDKGTKDVNHMGAVMAPAAADTIYRHLQDLNRSPDYYDLILTGDLGKYGKEILINYLKKVYQLDISSNYDDCGTIIYDTDKQPVLAGGSGPACSALVNYSYVYRLMKEKKLKRVLIVPTGALFSPTMFFQKESLPAIAHAVSLEVVEK